MNRWSKSSRKHLASAHWQLQVLFTWVLREADCSIVCGYRNEHDQNVAFKDGYSHVEYNLSLHNKIPSMAIDAMAYPIEWENKEKNAFFAGLVTTTARWLGIGLIWGHDWDQDNVPDVGKFVDVAHYQLVDSLYLRHSPDPGLNILGGSG